MDPWCQKPDSDLIKLALSGEYKAYDALLIRHQDKIAHIIRLHITDEEAVVDLVQDVLIKIYLSLPDFHNNCQFSTWLYSITLNSIKNYYRSHKVRLLSEQKYSLEKIDSSYYSPEHEVIGMELGSKLQECLENLPKKLQNCYLWMTIDGDSYEEIALKMHCPVGTVKSRISRLRQLIIHYITHN